MNMFPELVRRELRVALLPEAQPRWFRVAKWAALLTFTARYHDASWFWPVMAVCLVASVVLHFFHRWKNDVPAADGFR